MGEVTSRVYFDSPEVELLFTCCEEVDLPVLFPLSTGFDKGGATVEDVALMKANVGEGVLVKAAGGIASLEDADRFLTLGADRLGTSRIVRLVKEGNLL